MEVDERPLYEIFVFKEGDNGREAKGQWSPKVKTSESTKQRVGGESS
jgi:hypothetical protein